MKRKILKTLIEYNNNHPKDYYWYQIYLLSHFLSLNIDNHITDDKLLNLIEYHNLLDIKPQDECISSIIENLKNCLSNIFNHS